jgi:hypothetical protein
MSLHSLVKNDIDLKCSILIDIYRSLKYTCLDEYRDAYIQNESFPWLKTQLDTMSEWWLSARDSLPAYNAWSEVRSPLLTSNIGSHSQNAVSSNQGKVYIVS